MSAHAPQASASALLSLPDELLLQILSHNTPTTLRSRQCYSAWFLSQAANKRLLRLARDAFFHSYTQQVDLCCVYTLLTKGARGPGGGYTQTRTEGVFVGRERFVRLVRRVCLRVHVYYPESIETAIGEVRCLLARYPRLRSVRVEVSTTSLKVVEMLGQRIREELLKISQRPTETRPMEILLTMDLMGERVDERSISPDKIEVVNETLFKNELTAWSGII